MPINRNHISAYSSLELLARQVVEGFITGLHKSPFHGFSVEFAEHRQYNSGESTRHVDWKLYAKTERLYTKRYEEETNLRCRILIDSSLSMYFPYEHKPSFEQPNKITFAVYAAAAIMEMLRRQRDAIGLTLFSEDIDLHTQSKSNLRHMQLIYNYLEQLLDKATPEKEKGTKAAEAIHQVANTIHKRSLVVIFSDMFDYGNQEDIINAMRHLKHNKHEVMMFHVMDKSKELSLDYSNRPHRFVDLESGEQLKMNPNDVRSSYQEAVSDYVGKLKLKCAQYGIDFIDVDINQGFDDILLPYFVKRKKLY